MSLFSYPYSAKTTSFYCLLMIEVIDPFYDTSCHCFWPMNVTVRAWLDRSLTGGIWEKTDLAFLG